MLYNYLKIALRNLKKQKITTGINIIGFAIGMACCMLILFFVQYELSYDKFHKKTDRIFRVLFEYNDPDKKLHNVSEETPMPLGPTVKREFPEVLDNARIMLQRATVEYNDKQFIGEDIAFADSSLFDIFSFTFIKGDPISAFMEPLSVVLNEETAGKYFTNEDPIGKTIKISNRDFKVTAIVKKYPDNSSLQFGLVLPIKQYKAYTRFSEDWANPWNYTFILLNNETDPVQLEKKFTQNLKKYHNEDDAPKTTYRIQPLNRVHLYSKSDFGIDADGDYRLVIIYAAVAIFILLIACINFINITIGQSANRFREISLRKIMGAKKMQVIRQFWGEVVLLCLFSVMVSFILVELLLPEFNLLIGKNIKFEYDAVTFSGIFGIVMVTCFIAAVFPSIIISRFQPTEILKGKIRIGGGNKFTRTLIIIQFSLSIFFLSCTTIMHNQINFLMNKHKVPEDEVILNIDFRYLRSYYPDDMLTRMKKLYFEEISKDNKILKASVLPSGAGYSAFNFEGKKVSSGLTGFDNTYFDLFGISLKAGRIFDIKSYPTDMNEAVVVNESFVSEFCPESPVGKFIDIFGKKMKIIGICENFSFGPLKSKIPAQIYKYDAEGGGGQYYKFKKSDLSLVLGALNSKWKEIFPGRVSNFKFYEEEMRKLYSSEISAKDILESVSIIALLLSCFGILGLSISNIAKRIKEIGIRKVLGASAGRIVILLLKEFILMILFAGVISGISAYFYMNKWLQDFLYRTDISISTFLFSIGVTIIVTLVTVSFLTIRAAIANPVESLRYE
jgi:putative ABC transport system permease protein